MIFSSIPDSPTSSSFASSSIWSSVSQFLARPSTIDWCEENYVYSSFIAEFWNTTTSLMLCVVGLWCLWFSTENRYRNICVAVIVTGFGSAMFHGTLNYFWQMMDEIPMVWLSLSSLYAIRSTELAPGRHSNSLTAALNMVKHGCGIDGCVAPGPIAFLPDWLVAFLAWVPPPSLLIVYGVLWCIAHAWFGWVLPFQVHFIVLLLLGFVAMVQLTLKAPYRNVPDIHRLLKMYVMATLMTWFVWLADWHGCALLSHLPFGLPNPQMHAAWHLGCAYCVLIAGAFAGACRQIFLEISSECANSPDTLGRALETTKVQSPVRWFVWGLFPFVTHGLSKPPLVGSAAKKLN